MALIKGLHHISLKATSEEQFNKTVDFYKNVLKIPVIRHWKEGIMFDTGCGVIELFNNGKTEYSKGVIGHFAFLTENVEECVRAVTAAGYKVTRGPVEIDIPSSPVYPVKVAFCNGPLGEEIEFFEERK